MGKARFSRTYFVPIHPDKVKHHTAVPAAFHDRLIYRQVGLDKDKLNEVPLFKTWFYVQLLHAILVQQFQAFRLVGKPAVIARKL